jgi:hypothetical protein
MASLHSAGWRQGSLVEATLPLDSVVLGDDGLPVRQQTEHDVWVVAAQNCDLDSAETDDEEPTIELRPVYTEDPPDDWGIRSWQFLLTETEYVRSLDPRPLVSPAVLTALLAAGKERRELAADRQLALTTWLGLRYDRPAVPDDFVPLAKRIGEEVRRRQNRPIALRVRDVLMQFDGSTDPTRYSLFAILDDAGDEELVREWLAGIAARVPVELGIADVVEAAPATGISFHLIETSYAADVTQLTWRPHQPEPEGAV